MEKTIDSAFWKALVLGVLRQLLAGVSASLIAGGYLTEGQNELLLVGAAGLVVSLVWSIRHKRRVRAVIDAALSAPEGATYAEAKALMKE